MPPPPSTNGRWRGRWRSPVGQTPLNYAEETRANEEGSTHFASIASTNSRRAARATPAPSTSLFQLPTPTSPSSSRSNHRQHHRRHSGKFELSPSSPEITPTSLPLHLVTPATTSTLRRSCLLSRDAECRGSSAATTTSPETVVTFKRRPQLPPLHRPRRRGRIPPHQIFPPSKPGPSRPEFILFPSRSRHD